MRFFTNATEKVRIDSSGRVMVGTTTAGAVLTLDNTGQTSQALIHCEDVGGSGAHSHIVLKNTTGTVATINTVSDNLEFSVDDATVFANISGTERFRIGPDGTADFNSNTVQKAVLKNYTETIKAIGNTGTSATLDLADGNVFTATLNGNCTFTFTTGTNSAPNAASFTLILTNDGSAGRTIAWPASVKWPNASQPSRTTAASKTDIWSFMTPDNGTTWYGNIALYNFS